MNWKVCGMRDPDNIKETLTLRPDFMGFIFYEKSPRFIGNNPDILKNIVFDETKKVGVFVNHSFSQIVSFVKDFNLDMIQLHGDEGVELVEKLKIEGIPVIKVLRIKDTLPESEMRKFSPLIDYFLFDTQTEKYGGSGIKFNWSLLKSYNLPNPYFLSGGLDLEAVEQLNIRAFPGLKAIDLNSKFEIEPGLKSVEKLKEVNHLV